MCDGIVVISTAICFAQGRTIMDSAPTNGIIIDNRATRLAELVVGYSCSVRKGDKLLIAGDPYYADYLRLLQDAGLDRGAKVEVDTQTYDAVSGRHIIEHGENGTWTKERDRRLELIKWCDAMIFLENRADPDAMRSLKGIGELLARYESVVDKPCDELMMRPGPHRGYAIRWSVVGFPTAQSAKDAGMTLQDYTDFVYSASLTPDWPELRKDMRHIKRLFDNANDVHILVPGQTDLHLSLRGRGGEVCDGVFNMPDGEVCYGPRERSASGRIHFQIPNRPENRDVIDGITLEFKDGLVIRHDAVRNKKTLDELLRIPGSRRLGEFGIGCNDGIVTPTTNRLFDEKMGGTIHLALGYAYPQPLNNGGGRNKSSIHWDIICDLRRKESDVRNYPGGMLAVDGKVVQHNGKWIA